MNIVPIAFAFDNNLILPACVCISSLLINAKKGTFYDIFILHSENYDLDYHELDKIPQYYSNCRIQYRVVGNEFDNAFEIRGITTPAYYRLLIPELIPEYDKVIYSDVDVIFRMDLSELYSLDLKENYLAATKDLGLNLSKDGIAYIQSMPELHIGDYLQSGFIVINNKKILQDEIVQQLKSTAKRKLKYQDQDTLNIVCHGKISYISLEYNMTDYSFYYALVERNLLQTLYNKSVIDNAIKHGNLHFNGHKPWKKYCVNFDIWWEYYRKSPFFNEKFYFNFFYKKINEFEQMSLWKRIKLLIRYFIYGRKFVL